jgi:hypothetical protein
MVVKLRTTSPLITAGGIPMVELATINKALPEIARSIFRKKILLLKKSKNMFLSIICTFGYSWS